MSRMVLLVCRGWKEEILTEKFAKNMKFAKHEGSLRSTLVAMAHQGLF